MIRLFVAIDLPDEVRARLAALSSGVPGAKWVRPENLHLTLRFIGEIDGAMAADTAEVLADVRAPAFAMTLGEIRHFGSRNRIRALWAGVEPNAALEHLQAKVESALVRAGLEPESRKFVPHVTLARLKDARIARARDFLAASNPFQAGPIPVARFALYSSFLSQAGAIHRIEASYELDEAG